MGRDLLSKRPVMSILTTLNAKLNPICHLLALLGAHHIFHVSRIRVKNRTDFLSPDSAFFFLPKNLRFNYTKYSFNLFLYGFEIYSPFITRLYIYRVSREECKKFGRVFLMLKYTDITQNTYIQS
jgi:hypothetical protein